MAKAGIEPESRAVPTNGGIESPGNDPGNIDKIRDILFGNNIRDYDKRFVQLEEKIAADMDEMRQESRRMFEQLETFIRGEIQSLIEQLRTEQTDRTDSDLGLEKELEKLARRVSKDEEANAASLRDARQALLDQGKALHEEILAATRSTTDTIKREVQDLRFMKTDRSALAAALTDVAMRIGGESAPE